jgi:hypothetical protein
VSGSADLIGLLAGCPESDINLIGLQAALSRVSRDDAGTRARIVQAFEDQRPDWKGAANAMWAEAAACAAPAGAP